MESKKIPIIEAFEKHVETSNKNFAKLNGKTDNNNQAVAQLVDLISNLTSDLNKIKNRKNNNNEELITNLLEVVTDLAKEIKDLKDKIKELEKKNEPENIKSENVLDFKSLLI